MEPQKPPKKVSQGLKNAARLSGAGLQMGLTIYLGNLLGTWLDKKFGFSFLEITVTLVAIFLSIFSLIQQVNKINK
ncbi:AtpZ/AtpI family protein [Cellulophaga sp. Hel_I_12]|uniref:AtpZ/AtpI family protein n=1 Tax=Cellulophaga sp. Hel_I_12 TaxID=1249972 RepID=UPI000647DDE2|nr:AtpZ/AtpI family protein [Cellulophaga sp. Hel_I_12]